MLIEGFDRRQTMMMSAYNHPYYPKLVEALGFRKEVDFITCLIHRNQFILPARVRSIAERVIRRGSFKVLSFKNKKELLHWIPSFIKAYNAAFVNNWEYYPLTDWEVNFVVDNIMQFLDQDLIKIMIHKDEVVGFILSFPDISAALMRTRGYVAPLAHPGQHPPAPGHPGYPPRGFPDRMACAQRRGYPSRVQGGRRECADVFGDGKNHQQPFPAV